MLRHWMSVGHSSRVLSTIIRSRLAEAGGNDGSRAAKITTAPIPPQGPVVGVYTSSQIGKFGLTLPIGVIQVSPELAARTGEQKQFFIDVRKRAFIPFTRKFPLMDEPKHGIIGPAGKSLSREIIRQYRLVNERYPELIVSVGPLRP